ncbi:MAG TPA: hypothetical protein VGF67_06995 [Ktedonobacteraceae bacterium]|jgi:hypothetical protein
MNDQNQTAMAQQLQELDELYYTAPQALYEDALHLAVTQLTEMLPGLTIAYAEVWGEGSTQIQHGGMRHVLMPIERVGRKSYQASGEEGLTQRKRTGRVEEYADPSSLQGAFDHAYHTMFASV